MRRAWRALPLAFAVAWLAAVPVACAAQPAGDGAALLREGRYDEAIDALRARARSGEATLAEHRDLVRALAEVGRYDEAIRAARDASARSEALAAGLAVPLGRILYETGQLAEAEALFRRAAEEGSPDRLTAELYLAILQYERGERDAAMAAFDRFIDYYNTLATLSAADLTAVATAVRYLGQEDPRLFQDALRAYDEAIAADPLDFEPRLLLAEMFLEKYNAADAHDTFREVLAVNPRHPRALLGLARVLEFDGDSRAMELAASALEVNPNLVPARAFMARLHMGLEAFDEALAEVERALRVNPASLEALSVLASIHHVRGDTAEFRRTTERIFALNPRYADLYTTIAELSVQQRQYGEAVELARRAVELDPRAWRAYGVLGLNQLRIGEMEEGRANLETAFAGDPYDVWIKNTLDLLDTFERYEETPTGRFRIVIHERESALLAPYVAALAEEAFARLAERYGGEPPTPIRIELFPSHADFSVRTVGLTGLGALGVSFGAVVAMDSPSARSAGEFNWGSTLWHELAHSFHLALSDYRVPRWFSEGLAVLEERHARPAWGRRLPPAFLTALRDGRLLPIRELNNGFVRPTYPEQVGVSYFHASLVLEKIERDAGTDAIRRMLRGFAEGRTVEELFRSVVGKDIDAFDREFQSELRERYGRALEAIPAAAAAAGPGGQGAPSRAELETRIAANPNDFVARITLGRILVDAGEFDAAIPHLERARELVPDYTGIGNPYALLARIYRERGDLRRAAENLGRLVSLDETQLDANLEYAEVLEILGDTAGAAAALERVIYIHPFDMTLHARLAERYATLGEWDGAVRARLAVLALDPVDRASALYHLAYAYWRAGDAANARRNVLRALELAPHFREAQKLLLEISGAALAPGADASPIPGRAPAAGEILHATPSSGSRSVVPALLGGVS